MTVDVPPLKCLVLSVVKHDYVARAMAAHPRFQLVAVADDADQPQWAHERNSGFAEEFNIPYVADVERAISRFSPDVAIVSSAAERHCDLSIRAAAAGLHIVQDKPVGVVSADVDRLAEAVDRAGVRFLMWNRNGFPAMQHAARVVRAGDIGRVRSVHMDFYFAKDAGPAKGSRKPGYPPMDWLTYQLSAHVDGSDGGLGHSPIGELSNEGIYPLACIRMLCDQPVRRVYARTACHFHQVNDDNGVEDLATVTLEMHGGVLGTIALGRIGAASHASGGEIRLHVMGSSGSLVVQEARPEVGVYYRNQTPRQPRQRRVANENDFLLADDFASAIDENRDTMLHVHASRTIFHVVEAALESARLGQPVQLLDGKL